MRPCLVILKNKVIKISSISVSMQIWVGRQTVRRTGQNEGRCFYGTLLFGSQFGKHDLNDNRIEAANFIPKWSHFLCSNHLQHVYASICPRWIFKIPILMWSSDNVIQ